MISRLMSRYLCESVEFSDNIVLWSLDMPLFEKEVKIWNFDEMFVRMLTVHCDQNNSYEITINGFQVRK